MRPEFTRDSKGGRTPDLGQEKVTRAAFLYLPHNPKTPAHEFAQCDTCRMYVPADFTDGKKDLCILLGSTVKIGDEYSCGLYASWPEGTPDPKVVKAHAQELIQGIPGSVSAKQAGLVERQVRCQNCQFFSNGKTCELFVILNKSLPTVFDLDPNVEPYGCCNAQTPMSKY